MQWQLEIATILEPLVRLSGADRMRAAARWSTDSSSIPWDWILAALVGLVIVCGIAVGVAAYVGKKRKLSPKAFDQQAKEAGLTETEQRPPARALQQVGVGNPQAVSSAGDAGASEDGPDSIDLGPLVEDGPLSELLGQQADAKETAKVLVNPVEIWKGDTLLVRYPKGTVMWEFDARLNSAGEEVVVRPLGAARWVDRRRFERVYVDAKAWVAPLPFERSEPVDQPHSFVEARLTELATIGLRLEAPVDVQVGQRVLVIVPLSGRRRAEAMGIVRRCWDPTAGGHDFAVELIGLHSDEVEQLDRETKTAKSGEAPQHAPGEPPAEAEPVAQA